MVTKAVSMKSGCLAVVQCAVWEHRRSTAERAVSESLLPPFPLSPLALRCSAPPADSSDSPHQQKGPHKMWTLQPPEL